MLEHREEKIHLRHETAEKNPRMSGSAQFRPVFKGRLWKKRDYSADRTKPGHMAASLRSRKPEYGVSRS